MLLSVHCSIDGSSFRLLRSVHALLTVHHFGSSFRLLRSVHALLTVHHFGSSFRLLRSVHALVVDAFTTFGSCSRRFIALLTVHHFGCYARFMLSSVHCSIDGSSFRFISVDAFSTLGSCSRRFIALLTSLLTVFTYYSPLLLCLLLASDYCVCLLLTSASLPIAASMRTLVFWMAQSSNMAKWI
eukprot:scaffold97115_cov30-Cyclotella_meneghiniana.AAC.1